MTLPLPWHTIDTVLLDMDGTILDLHFDNYFWLTYLPQVFASANGLSFATAKQQLTEQFDAIRGTLDWYCLDYWSDTLKLDIAELKKTIAHKVAFRPQAEEFLQFLKQQQKHVFLVTNAHQKSLEIKLLNSQFHHYFDDLISSHQFAAPKEEQTFWQQLHQRLRFEKSKTLFIDDSLSILHSAQAFGIGFVLGIAQPDSQQPPRHLEPFYAIENFRDIMPVNNDI
jgi:putative hydrolase of the HAD superfamily